ncbi:MAG: enoyl-CoA hydratase/isomerase family protein [Actinomycetota bacterium]|nr:enoyl-CoA hydratase/isomerase family protein [Actinomycetota bacterium]
MSVVELSFSGPRADLRLNRPEVLNAMSLEVFDALATATEEIAARDDIHVVVVSGEGRSFSSGIDVSSLGGMAGAPAELVARAQSGFRKLATLEMPTVAAVQGHAYGAGLQLALMCDLRVVAEDASLGLLEMRYGLIPDLGGSTRLPQLVGAGRAKKMIMLAERIDGRQAERIGLAEGVVPASDLVVTVDEVAARLAEPPHTAKRWAKRLVDRAHLVSQTDGMDAEAEAQLACMSSPEFPDAVARSLAR